MSTLKRVLALSLALAMVLSINVFAADFSDKNEFEAVTAEAIDMLVALEILAGFPDGSFQPNETITRAQAAKMIYVICNKGADDGAAKYVGGNTFHDVEAGSWYEGYVEFCYTTGVIIGRGNDTVSGKPVFDPNAAVTGYELAKMLLVVGNYNPNVEGFNDSANWKNNVLRFANNTGLIEDYAVLMSLPAPRQWASLMFSNLITKVLWATYLGDSLVTGSNLEFGNELVGVKLLGLVEIVGVAVQNKAISLVNGGWDEDGYTDSLITGAVYRTGPTAGQQIAISKDIPAELLGQEIKVLAKATNTSLSGAPLVNKNNLTILSIYPTGKSIVTDMTMADFSVSAADNNMTLKVKVAGINDGKEMKQTIAVGATQNTAIADTFAKIYGSDYTAFGLAAFDSSTSSAIDAYTKAIAATFGTRKDAIVAVDTLADGIVDYFFVKETTYGRVSSINATRISVNGMANGNNVSENVTAFNFTDGTPERNDILAMTKNYTSGELVYDTSIIKGVTVKATAWTATSVTLDGTVHKVANQALAGLNNNHTVYYLHNGFVVYSSDAASNAGIAPSDVGVITAVGDADRNTLGRYSVTVEYMGVDGKKVEKKYDFSETNAIGKAAYDAVAIGDVVGGITVTAANLSEYKYKAGQAVVEAAFTSPAQGTLVQIVETTDGVAFKAIGTSTYSDLDFVARAGNVLYDAANKVIEINGASNKYDLGTGATIFALYETSKLKAVKGEDLGAITATYVGTRLNYGALVDSNDTVVALYIDFGTGSLPTETVTKQYMVITGDPYNSGNNKVFVKTTASVDDIEIGKIDTASISGQSGIDALATYKTRMVEYTVSSGVYTVKPIISGAMATDYHYTFNAITTSDDTTFKAGGTFTYDEKTLFFQVDGTTVKAVDYPIFGGANSTVIISKAATTGALVEYAVAVVVNVDATKNVQTENILAKVPTAPVTYTVTYNSNDATVLTVPAPQVDVLNANITLAVGTTMTPPAGKVFDKWTTAADGTGASYLGGAAYTVTGNATLYAQWITAPLPLPVPGLALATTTNVFNNISLTASVTGAPAGLTYQWYKNGTAIAGATAATFTATTGYNAGDVITVKANATGCTETTAPTSVTLTQAAAPTYTLATGAVLTLTSYNVSIDTASIPADAGNVTVTWTIKEASGTKTLTSVGNDLLYAHMTTYMGMLAPANQWTLAAGDEVSYVITSDNYATVTVANSAATEIA